MFTATEAQTAFLNILLQKSLAHLLLAVGKIMFERQ